MKQKILTLFLALAASVGFIFAQSGESGYIHWQLSNGTLTISSNTGNPVAMNGYTVLDPAPWSTYNDKIKSIVVNKVTAIGDRAFWGSAVEQVTLSDDVESIYDACFGYCHDLKSITLPAKVWRIGNKAFSNCSSLEYVDIKRANKVLDCGEEAFLGTNTNLNIYVPYLSSSEAGDSLITEYLASDDWKPYADKIKPLSPGNCGINVKWEVKDGTLTISKVVSNQFPATIDDIMRGLGPWYYWKPTSLEILEGIGTIGQYAFQNCEKLESATLPKSLTEIKELPVGGIKPAHI